MERLDKLLARTGRWSRREAKALIKAGKVQLEGEVLRDEAKKLPDTACITVDGAALSLRALHYLMMNKPQGLLSATVDAKAPTVLDCLPEYLRKAGLFPAGRLDKDTVGLLLLTNDGVLAHRILSPRARVPKRYLARVQGVLDEGDVAAFRAGMLLRDQTRCLPASLEILPGEGRCAVTLEEGKYHQVKRMLAARGKPVLHLQRISIGPLELDPSLEEGMWRELTEKELILLRSLGKADGSSAFSTN